MCRDYDTGVDKHTDPKQTDLLVLPVVSEVIYSIAKFSIGFCLRMNICGRRFVDEDLRTKIYGRRFVDNICGRRFAK